MTGAQPADPSSQEVVEAMRAMTTEGDAAAWRRLLAALSAATLLVPTEEGDVRSSDSDTVELMVAEGPDGTPAFLAFTDPDALAAWSGASTPCLRVPTAQLSRAVLEHQGASLVINPAGPWGGELAASDIERLAEGLALAEGTSSDSGAVRGDVLGGTSVRILALEQEPPALLVGRLGAFLAEEADAAECWLFSGAFSEGPVHLMIGIVPSESDPEALGALLARAGDVAAGALPAGVYADVLALSGEMIDAARAVGRRVPAA